MSANPRSSVRSIRPSRPAARDTASSSLPVRPSSATVTALWPWLPKTGITRLGTFSSTLIFTDRMPSAAAPPRERGRGRRPQPPARAVTCPRERRCVRPVVPSGLALFDFRRFPFDVAHLNLLDFLWILYTLWRRQSPPGYSAPCSLRLTNRPSPKR